MDEQLIIKLAATHIENGKLSYVDFDNIYNFLSIQEQYKVVEILHTNNIELYDNEEETHTHSNPSELSSIHEEAPDQLEIVYDDSFFTDDYAEKTEQEEKESDPSPFLLVRNNISMSNITLIRLIQEGNNQAKQDLCIKNHGLVATIATYYQKMAGNKLELDDLIQAGMIGMLRAASLFDVTSVYSFSTYATYWIKQAITREIDDHGFTIRIPVHRMEQIFRVCRLDSQHSGITDRDERWAKISEESGYSIQEIENCLILYSQFLKSTSLDVPVGDDDITLGELIPDNDVELVEDIVIHKLLREDIEILLSTLTEREQTIIRLRFGLDDGRIQTLEEIGQQFNVTRERIRQIEAKALKKLKHPSRSRRLAHYLK